jgi:hypothetical protein
VRAALFGLTFVEQMFKTIRHVRRFSTAHELTGAWIQAKRDALVANRKAEDAMIQILQAKADMTVRSKEVDCVFALQAIDSMAMGKRQLLAERFIQLDKLPAQDLDKALESLTHETKKFDAMVGASYVLEDGEDLVPRANDLIAHLDLLHSHGETSRRMLGRAALLATLPLAARAPWIDLTMAAIDRSVSELNTCKRLLERLRVLEELE